MCLSLLSGGGDLSSQHYFPQAHKTATGTEMRKCPGEWDCREPNTVPGQDSVGHKSVVQLKSFAREYSTLRFHYLGGCKKQSVIADVYWTFKEGWGFNGFQ